MADGSGVGRQDGSKREADASEAVRGAKRLRGTRGSGTEECGLVSAFGAEIRQAWSGEADEREHESAGEEKHEEALEDGATETAIVLAEGTDETALVSVESTAEPPEVSNQGDTTTLMLMGLPHRVMLANLEHEVGNMGFAGKYNFIHIPIHRKSGNNRGYGFINFVHPSHATHFASTVLNYDFPTANSFKRISVMPAEIQGLRDNFEKFRHLTEGEGSEKNQTRFYF
eukprot:TRINITY_DN10935_c0_g1_i1.p1 TRINITY_DN10935_c0_g1~~TRINITY_DN10935_c0_g1_i1.p1  ORF type:complete len:242 (-),score=37.14 TRINITY_DN10935_c0_g1_i1:40-723(-)